MTQRIPAPEEASVAEFAVIGSCMVDTAAVAYATANVDEDHFLEPKNKMLFKVIKRLYSMGVEVDVVTIQGHLTAYEQKMIGLAYVADLAEKVPTALNVRHYADIMRNRAITVILAKQYEKLRADPFNDDTQKEVARLWDRLNNNGASVISLKDASVKYSETLERRRNGKEFRVLTGYGNFDHDIGGFFGGNLIAVGARTSLGKSALLINMALRFIKQNLRVLFVSAEMITDEILDRMVAIDANLPIAQLRKGHVQAEELKNVHANLANYYELPMWFLEGGKMSLGRLRTAIEAVNPSIIFVDFIQRFVPPNPAMNRAAYFSDLINELKATAMSKKMIVFVASQLNRDIEKEGSRPPQLSDFKESGGIEEAADIAIMLQHKKPGKGEPIEGERRRIILHVLKNRNGPTGRVPFSFQKSRTLFLEEEPDPPML